MFKHAEAEDWFYYIDKKGNKGQSWNAKNRPELHKEMLVWVAEGNEILPKDEPISFEQQEAERIAKLSAEEKTAELEAEKKQLALRLVQERSALEIMGDPDALIKTQTEYNVGEAELEKKYGK